MAAAWMSEWLVIAATRVIPSLGRKLTATMMPSVMNPRKPRVSSRGCQAKSSPR